MGVHGEASGAVAVSGLDGSENPASSPKALPLLLY